MLKCNMLHRFKALPNYAKSLCVTILFLFIAFALQVHATFVEPSVVRILITAVYALLIVVLLFMLQTMRDYAVEIERHKEAQRQLGALMSSIRVRGDRLGLYTNKEEDK